MIKASRNEPCPCGSGKTYKKCCLNSDEATDSQYRRVRQVEADLAPRLLEYALETFGDESILDAWDEFNDDESEEGPDPESPMNMVFIPWFLFNWTEQQFTEEFLEPTMAESFLEANKGQLTPDEEMFLKSANRCPFSLCEIVQVKPGVGMTQVDLLRGIKYEVAEKMASEILKRGEIIYCASSEIAGIRLNIANSPFALPPTAKMYVLALRKWLVTEIGAEQITAAELLEFESEIRGLYLKLLGEMFAPPELANTDGHPMVPQELHFQLASSDRAFHGLKDLAEGIPESQLLEDAVLKEGRVVSAEIPWLGGTAKVRKQLGGPVLLGNIAINDREMIVEVNSDERSESIRRLIEEKLGTDATYITTEFEPLEKELAAAAAAGKAATCIPDLDDALSDDSLDDILSQIKMTPELRAKWYEMNRQYWESWFDLPVPALNNLTPREAA